MKDRKQNNSKLRLIPKDQKCKAFRYLQKDPMSWPGGSLDTAVEDELACVAGAERGDGPVKGNGGGGGNREKRKGVGKRKSAFSIPPPSFSFPPIFPNPLLRLLGYAG